MPEYDNTNRGAIWPNDKMRPDKQDPQFTGSLNVDGVEYWVSAWKRKPDAKQGAPSLSFSVKPKDSQREPNPHQPQVDDFEDSTIPFQGGLPKGYGRILQRAGRPFYQGLIQAAEGTA